MSAPAPELLDQGLDAIGEAATRTTGGVGYSSGYSPSRAVAHGWLVARHAAGAA